MAKVIFAAFIQGWLRACRHPFLILLKWLVNLLFAWLLVMPISDLLARSLDHSQIGLDMFSSGIHYAYIIEFKRLIAAQLGVIEFYQYGLVLLFFVMNLYLSGGVLSLIWGGDSRPDAFFRAARNRLPALLFTSLLAIPIFCLLVGLPLLLLAFVVDWLQTSHNLTASAFYLWWGGFVGITIFMSSFVLRVYDYSRLLLCGPSPAGLLSTLGQALKFTVRYHLHTFFLLIAFLLLHPLLIWLFALWSGSPVLGLSLFWWELCLGQLLVIARITSSLARQCGQLALFQAMLPPVAPSSKPDAEDERLDIDMDDIASYPWEPDPLDKEEIVYDPNRKPPPVAQETSVFASSSPPGAQPDASVDDSSDKVPLNQSAPDSTADAQNSDS